MHFNVDAGAHSSIPREMASSSSLYKETASRQLALAKTPPFHIAVVIEIRSIESAQGVKQAWLHPDSTSPAPSS